MACFGCFFSPSVRRSPVKVLVAGGETLALTCSYAFPVEPVTVGPCLSCWFDWWQGHLQSAKSNDVGAFTVVVWNNDLVEELEPLDHISVKILRPVITGPRVSRMVCSGIWQTFFFFSDVDFSLACIMTLEGLLSGFIMGYGINAIIISRFDFHLLSKCRLLWFVCFVF